MGLPPSAIQRWKIPVRNGPDIGGKVKGSRSKTERTARKVYRTRDAARAVDYIERFYNPKRRHSKLGDLSVRSRLIVRPLLEELRLPLVPALEGVVRRPALQDGLR